MITYGIDFGTNNSCISYYNNKSKQVIFLEPLNDKILLPSVISFINENPIIGIDVPNYDKIRCPKRNLSLDNKNSILYSSLLLKKLREATKEDSIDAVVTIPVNYTHTQREATKVACKLAKINIIRLINEPTAVAIAYGVKEELILILDIGAGTTDISILEYDQEEKLYQVIYTDGDSKLGGEDINLIIYHRLNKIINNFGSYTENYNLIEQIKFDLCYKEYVKIHNYILNRNEFFLWCTDFFNKIITLLNKAQEINPDIKKILLAGGGVNLLGLKYIITKNFPHLYVYQHNNPGTLVSKGASLYSYSLTSQTDNFTENKITLIDILPLNIGVKTQDDIFVPIIDAGSIIPITKSKVFGICEDYEQYIDIEIFQGNRKLCSDNYFIGKVEIDLLTKRKKNEVRIEVSFTIDINSILAIKIKELRSSVEVAQIFSKDTLNIDKNLLDDIIKNSNEFKKIDSLKEKECLLRSKLHEKINILQLNDVNLDIINNKLTALTDNIDNNINVLKNIIDYIDKNYSLFIKQKDPMTYEPEKYDSYIIDNNTLKDNLIELIETILLTNINEEKKQYILNIQNLLSNNKEHTLDLNNEYQIISDMVINETDEYNYLITTIKLNIDNFKLTIEQKESLLIFIDTITNNDNILFNEKIKLVNEYCEKLI